MGVHKVYNLKKEALALDKWSKTDEATALCQFCNQRNIYAQRLYEWRDESPDFAETLKIAKSRIAERLRTRMHEGTYNYGLFMSEIGFHDTFHHDYLDAHKVREHELKKLLIKYEYELKQEATQAVTEELKEAHNAVMAQLSELQSQRKAAKSKGKSVDKSA